MCCYYYVLQPLPLTIIKNQFRNQDEEIYSSKARNRDLGNLNLRNKREMKYISYKMFLFK